MDDEKNTKHDDGPVQQETSSGSASGNKIEEATAAKDIDSNSARRGKISRPTEFHASELRESARTDSVNELAPEAQAKATSGNLPSGPIISINDSLNALAVAQQQGNRGQASGQADTMSTTGTVGGPPLSPDSYVSSTCSGDMESPTTSGTSEILRIVAGVVGSSEASSPTSSATSSGMSIGPEYSQSYPQPSVRPKDHRNATWPEGLTSSSIGAGVLSRQRPHSSNSVGSLPLEHGTVTRDGEMVSYVADDLLEKIRKSASPRSSLKGTSSPSTISRSSSRSSFASSAIPPIDPTALADLEKHSKRVADSLDLMMGHLTSTLHNMSAISVGHIQTYRDAVDKAGLTVDQSVKAMYALIAKCEELNRTMVPVEDLAKQIKAIKKQLDDFEVVCK